MIRKYKDLDGIWHEYEYVPKKFIFIHPTCTDKSKFIPEQDDNSQYNGNATGNDPQYDYPDGKITGSRAYMLRTPGLDVSEIDEFISETKSSAKKHLSDIQKTVDEVKAQGVDTDSTVRNV